MNRVLRSLGLIHEPRLWLNGKPSTVVLGLVYGYVPYMILPLYAMLDRIDRSLRRRRATWAAARPDVPPRDAAAVATGHPGRLRHRDVADVRRLLHADAALRARADRDVRQPHRELDRQLAGERRAASLVIILIVLLIAADALLPAQHERGAEELAE